MCLWQENDLLLIAMYQVILVYPITDDVGFDCLIKSDICQYSSILAWEIPRTEEPSGLQSMVQSMESQRSDTTEPTCTGTWAMSQVNFLILWLSSTYVGECSCF